MSTKKKHICPHENCKSAFIRPYRLAQHLLVHEKKKSFQCSENGCNKSYTNNSHLRRHIDTVHKQVEKEYIYSCPDCIKKFANRQNLKRHIKIYHELAKVYLCDVCKTSFKKKNQLSAHMYQHTGVMSFCCDFCPKSFITLHDKKRHMRIHKTYKCTSCSATFNLWSKYQRHKKIEHNQEFICDYCHRNFKVRTHVIRHMRSHHIVSNDVFICQYESCTRSYKNKRNLKHHIRVKHLKITHDCNVCNAKLCTKTKLMLHMKLHNKPDSKSETNKKNIRKKERKDKGSFKTSTAMKLAGFPKNITADYRILPTLNEVVVVK